MLEDAIAEHRQRLESGPPVISQDEAAELTHEELEEAVRMMEQVARVQAKRQEALARRQELARRAKFAKLSPLDQALASGSITTTADGQTTGSVCNDPVTRLGAACCQ